MSTSPLPDLPTELQGKIFQLAAQGSSLTSCMRLMLVSRIAYDRVTYIAYRIISITTDNSFKAFHLLVKTRGVAFIALRLRGLHIRVFFNGGRSHLVLWRTLITSFIPRFVNLQYFEACGSLANEVAVVVPRALLLKLPTLANLTYFGANTSMLPDSATADYPIFRSVTHLKRFNHQAPVEATLHLLKSFPNLTHFMTPITRAGLYDTFTPLFERLSHLKVVVVAPYGTSDIYDLTPLEERFPNLVFRDIDELFNRADVPRFREIAGEGFRDIWLRAEDEILWRTEDPPAYDEY